eukprot:278948_1
MQPLLITFFIRSIFSYQITFSSKNNFFSNVSVSNPYSNLLHGVNYTSDNVILICYELFDFFASQRNGDCKLGALNIQNNEIQFSDIYVFDTLAADNYEIQLYSHTGPLNNFLIGYTNAGDSSKGPGTLIMGTFDIEELTIKYGEPITFNSNNNDQSNVVELERDDGYFAVCYSVGNNDQKGTGCKIGQYYVDSLSVKVSDYLYLVPSEGPTDGMSVSHIGNSSILVCWADTGHAIGMCSIGIIDDLVTNGLNAKIEFKPAVTFNGEGGTDEIKIRRIFNNESSNYDFILCYVSRNDGACSYLVVDVSDPNNVLLYFKSRTVYAARDRIDQNSIQCIPSNVVGNDMDLVVICYVDLAIIGEVAECVFGEINTEKMMVVFDENENHSVFRQGKTDRIDTLYLGGTDMVVCYVDITNPRHNTGQCVFGIISE